MGRWFSGVRPPADWRRRLVGVGLITIGVAGVGIAGWAYYDEWATRQSFDASPEAATLQREADAPTPIWIDATPVPVAAGDIAPVPTQSPPDLPLFDVVPTPGPTATADQLSLDATDFRFLDPPEPGAHARVAISITNHSDAPSSRILLGIDANWFDNYSIIGTAPAISADRTDDTGMRTFSFPPVGANSTVSYELHVTATAEGTTAPAVTVLDAGGSTIGADDSPKTFAPQPRPGPVMAIDIPRLKLHTGVLQVAWEPPPFTVGQIKDTANITQGNTVLVGHLTGAAGNVFAHLDELEPGDEITATSRGLPYKFVVSQTFEGANTDATPIDPAPDSRLTLMTCAGIWNPFTHDYSERLWVVAEPPEQAAVTIANAQATATVVAATATVLSATATAQATADAAATATAIAELPTPTPLPPPTPTPFAGQPSQQGGIGNTRIDLEHAFGQASGETSGKLVVFRQPGHELHVRFSPEPPRAALLADFPSSSMSLTDAVQDARRLMPSDAQPRTATPEGNSQFVVERFTSDNLATVLGLDSGDFSVIYTKDARGGITSIIIGPGDDLEAMLADAKK